MKIYEGTDGLRGLITKLIEVWDFKKIVYEGDATLRQRYYISALGNR